MKQNRIYSVCLFVSVTAFLLMGLCPVTSFSAEQISKPGQYSGYAESIYTEWVRSSQYIEVWDGTKLAVDIYRPAVGGVAVDIPYPALFNFTPYRRAYYRNGQLQLNNSGMTELIQYGYVIVVGDVRGKGASYGTRVSMAHISEGWDAHDIVEWIASQDWCTGEVGMFGASANAHTTLSAAATQPPSLKAIFPQVTEYDLYDGWMRGGMHRSTGGGGGGQNDLATAPVDEDTLDENNNGIMDMLEAAVAEHAANTPYLPLQAELPFRDSISQTYPEVGQFWLESSFSQYAGAIAESGIGIYHVGGWYDLFTRDTVLGWVNAPESNAKLLMHPGGHFIFGGDNGGIDLMAEQHRFFDYWLKGIENGIMEEPPITYYTMGAPEGKQWRYAWQWPLPNEKKVTFYLQEGPSGSEPNSAYDGSLRPVAPTEAVGRDSFVSDYSVACSHLMGHCIYDQWGITYTTDPLEEDIELTGHPVLSLWVDSTATDGDFFADLEEVDEDGNVSLAAVQGRLRASHRKLDTSYYDFLDLPWHRSFEEDMEPMIPGIPAELLFDILPTSNIFDAGHRIRLTINTASKHVLDFLQYDPAPVVEIYRNAQFPSSITLPVITNSVSVNVRIKPETMNLKSKGRFTVFIEPAADSPAGYRAADIDISTVTCGGAPAVKGVLVQDVLQVKFNTEDLVDIDTGNEIPLKVEGRYYYDIPFEGVDLVRVKK